MLAPLVHFGSLPGPTPARPALHAQAIRAAMCTGAQLCGCLRGIDHQAVLTIPPCGPRGWSPVVGGWARRRRLPRTCNARCRLEEVCDGNADRASSGGALPPACAAAAAASWAGSTAAAGMSASASRRARSQRVAGRALQGRGERNARYARRGGGRRGRMATRGNERPRRRSTMGGRPAVLGFDGDGGVGRSCLRAARTRCAVEVSGVRGSSCGGGGNGGRGGGGGAGVPRRRAPGGHERQPQ